SHARDAGKFPDAFTFEQPLGLLVSEAPDHEFILRGFTSYVKRTIAAFPGRHMRHARENAGVLTTALARLSILRAHARSFGVSGPPVVFRASSTSALN